MQYVLRLIAIVVVAAVLSSVGGYAQESDPDELERACREKPEQSFGTKNGNFWIYGKEYKGSGLYCVIARSFAPGNDEFIIRWEAAKMDKVKTTNGIEATQFWSCAPQTKFTNIVINFSKIKDVAIPLGYADDGTCPNGIPKGHGWLTRSTILGGLPSAENPKKYIRVLIVVITSVYTNGTCVVEIKDMAASQRKGGGVLIRLPRRSIAGAFGKRIEKARRIAGEVEKYVYSFSDSVPIPVLLGLSITNYDGQEVATIPAVLCALK